jgi:cell division septal protein FtsQ
VGRRKKPRKNYRKGTKKKRQFSFLRRLATGFYVIAGVAALLITSLLFVFVHDVITQCDYFKAKSLKIEGVQRLSQNQIIEAARVKKGMNVLDVNLAMARKRLRCWRNPGLHMPKSGVISPPGLITNFWNIPRWKLSIWAANSS